MRNYCDRCNGSGRIKDLNEPFWKVWKKMICPVCNGTGEALPIERPKGRPPPPPPRPKKKTEFNIAIFLISMVNLE